MTHEDLITAIHDIGLALNSAHNTVTTDDTSVTPGPQSWVIDFSKEIELLEQLEKQLINNSGTCPLCGCCKNVLLTERE